jgi:hypothetical protein
VAHTEYVRGEFWGGGPAQDVYIVKERDDSIDTKPEVVDELFCYQRLFWQQRLWRVVDQRPFRWSVVSTSEGDRGEVRCSDGQLTHSIPKCLVEFCPALE